MNNKYFDESNKYKGIKGTTKDKEKEAIDARVALCQFKRSG